ncbi:ATP-binding protein [Aestuariibius sp. 2305UL40-4]|uniref:sensor histidine kinase n=1 Tax=Aestuariibius violaceus TaxID=3234132 RepID=UPI00345E6E80
MTSRPLAPARRHAFALTALLVLALGCLAALPRIEERLSRQAEQDNTVTLGLVVQAVDQLVRRFDPIPELVAERPDLRSALADPQNRTQILYANERLRLAARATGASDIYLMDLTGTTIATSNYRRDDSFLGRNFSYRPYFRQAARGRAAFFHALGTTSGQRGLFFSAPVLDGIDVIGVVAVKVTVDGIEDSWSHLSGGVAVADGNGLIFMASRPDWIFTSLTPLSDGLRAEIAETRQVPLSRLAYLNPTISPLSGGVVQIALGDGDAAEGFLVSSEPVALPGWHAIVLKPLAPLQTRALEILASWAAAALALVLLLTLLLQRIARRRELERLAQQDLERLEIRVQERTAELKREVDDRKRAENQLRETQQHLVQAGKLAALGKMSAALSHEINQPLAAIKSYAANAAAYLDRDRPGEARENVLRISQMTNRVSRISTHLLNFARRPGDNLGPVEVGRALTHALELMAPEFRTHDIAVDVTKPDEPLWTLGGEVRLEQVLVNILTNAVSAMPDADRPRIGITVGATQDALTIAIRDQGPGLDPDAADKLFEPFFSARPDGRGLGLGLSISYNIIQDFGGDLTARTHPDGGAEFTIHLKRARIAQEAAPA